MAHAIARLLVILATCFSWPSQAAQISSTSSCEWEEAGGGDSSDPHANLPLACIIDFAGRIEPGDADRLRTEIEKLKSLPRQSGGLSAQIRLSSLGGDVKEAITIGRLIRREALQTFVVNASCVSACVLVLASGVERYVLGGRVGIRSPYSESSAPQEAYERTRQRRGALNGAIRAYFREMDIPEALLAVMNRVPSDEVNWLNLHQLSVFQLIGEDAAWREWKAANEAKKLGVSLSELLARKAKVGRICQGGPTYSSCAERIMHGN